MTLNFLNMNNMYGMTNFSGMLGSCLNSSMLFNPMGSNIWGSLGLGGGMYGIGGCQSPFVNCDGTYNYEKAFTASLVSQGISLVGGLIGLGVQERKANSLQTLDNNLEYVNSEIQKGLKDLGNGIEPALTEKTYADHTAKDEPWYKEEEEAIKYQKETNQAIIDRLGKSSSLESDLRIATSERDSLEKQIADSTDESSKSQLKTKLDAKLTEIENLNANLEKVKKAEAEIKNAEAREAKLETDRKTRQTKIDLSKKDVSTLIEKRNAIQPDVDNATLDKANGSRLTRTSDKAMSKLLTEDGTKWAEGADIDKRDVQNIVSHFSSTGNIAEKRKYAQLLVALRDDQNLTTTMTKTQMAAIEIADTWLRNNPES